jgi:regulator of sigma D
MQNTNTYEIVWDLVHGIKSPETEEEKKIYNNMKDKTKYFSNFKDKESYVAYNCAYWNYGYLDENGWKDMDDDGKELDWITNFFDRFVSKLKPNDKITIYECSRSDD